MQMAPWPTDDTYTMTVHATTSVVAAEPLVRLAGPMAAPALSGVSSSWTLHHVLKANATISFVLASMVNSLLHESAHAVAGLVQGLTPTISPFSVEFALEGTTSQQVVTAAAGPLFSLVMGLVLMAVARTWGRGTVRLF